MVAKRFGPYTQTATGTWAASSTIRTNLERLGLITRIVVTAEVTPSADLTAANQPGGLYKAFLNLRILAGGKVFMELPNTGEGALSGAVLHAMNMVDFGGMPAFPDQQTDAAPNRTYYPVSFVLHCGSRPHDHFGRDNPFDLTGFIPSTKLVDLLAEVQTSLNSVMDDTVTISSGTYRYTLYYVSGNHGEVQQEMQRQGVRLPSHLQGQGATGMVPSWVGATFALDATYSDYSLTRDVPVGRYLKRVFIASQDATGTRPLLANDEVTAVKFKIRSNDILQANQEALAARLPKGNFFVADDAVEFGAGGHPKGIIPLDLRESGHPDYGYDLTRGEAAQTGAAQLAMTVTTQTSGDDALFLYEGYEPWYGDLGT